MVQNVHLDIQFNIFHYSENLLPLGVLFISSVKEVQKQTWELKKHTLDNSLDSVKKFKFRMPPSFQH